MSIATVKNVLGGGYDVELSNGQTLCVPDDVNNRDYVRVQAWINDGNTPGVADPAPSAPALAQAITNRRAGDPVIEEIFTRLETAGI